MNYRAADRVIAIILVIFAIGLGFPFSSLAKPAQAVAPKPVWGTKPVLSYLALTEGLKDRLRQGASLTDDQFQQVQEIARREAEDLRRINLDSLPIVQDPAASLEEKRSLIQSSGFNRKVAGVVENTNLALRSALGEDNYQRLAAWTEAEWPAQAALHGAAQAAAGRSYQVLATLYDAGGAYTVALPDKCLKFANNGSHSCDGYGYKVGSNYSVKIQNGSKSVKAPVGEAGPWNVDDNYWSTVGDPQPRRMFTDLPLGMPEAQAAYYDNYNDGKDQYGREVTSPMAVDIAMDVGADLGMSGNAWVTVTYLWTDGWEANPVETVTLNEPTKLTPAYNGNQCSTNWLKITGYSNSSAYLTLNVANNSTSTNWAEWRPDLPVAGEYQVQAFIPDHAPITWACSGATISRDTASARYSIHHAGGDSTVKGNQGPVANQWLDLGTYSFEAGDAGYVKLTDITGETDLTTTVSFSAVRFIREVPATPPPTPPPTPTPTPTPQPQVWAGSGSLDPNAVVAVPLQAFHIPDPGAGTINLELRYDPQVIEPQGCQADPGGKFDFEACNPNYERDGVNPDSLQLQLSSPSGAPGNSLLGQITFKAIGAAGTVSPILPSISTFTDPNGAAIQVKPVAGYFCIQPCRNLGYLPLISQVTGLAP